MAWTKYDAEKSPMVAAEACRGGASLTELCKVLGIRSRATVHAWMARYPEFLAAVMEGRKVATEIVVNSLFQRAIGFVQTDEETVVKDEPVFVKGTKDEPGEWQVRKVTKTKKTVKHVPGDVDAQKFWLTNRAPDEWRNKQDTSFTDKDGQGILPVFCYRPPVAERPEEDADA